MKKLIGFLGGFATVAFVGFSADAASAPNARGGDVARYTAVTTSARMPSMPAGMGGVVGADVGGNTTYSGNTGCTPGDTQSCLTSTGDAGTQTCNNNGVWGTCVANPVEEYTIDECMNSILACITAGALPGGIEDMYDSNLRNSIISGMGLCKTQVDYCVANIGIYNDSTDVWIDFNSRVIQPQYYSFILRKTGLTPNQAENTCWLIDKNVYGKSFAAIGSGTVKGEYGEAISPYNNTSSAPADKNNPQGPNVNTATTYDSDRGHYARWDATAGECLIRVAAYNKDDLITNRWLGIGDDKAAEVWKPAGSSFSCNKELFEFGLMNKTKSAAVLSGAGVAVGTGVGYAFGAAKDKKLTHDNFCDDKRNLEKLSEQLFSDSASKSSSKLKILNEYLTGELTQDSPKNTTVCKRADGEKVLTYKPYLSINTGRLNKSDCENIMALYDKYLMYQGLIDTGVIKNSGVISENIKSKKFSWKYKVEGNMSGGEPELNTFIMTESTKLLNKNDITEDDISAFKSAVEDKAKALSVDNTSIVMSAFNSSIASASIKEVEGSINNNTFHSISLAWDNTSGVSCNSCEDDCVDGATIIKQVNRIGGLLNILDLSQEDEMSKKAKGALIGAGVSVGVGGLTTAITAFVEKNNINCRVGDGLDKVQMGKSGNIDTLKDFYVKWNLALPDTIAPTPTAPVTNCETWTAACSTMSDISNCTSATINYMPAGAATSIRVFNGCAIVNNMCVENLPVAVSHGACP